VPTSSTGGSPYVCSHHARLPLARAPLSLHDALPIWQKAAAKGGQRVVVGVSVGGQVAERHRVIGSTLNLAAGDHPGGVAVDQQRSEEHTSELQSRFDLVCRLLLEKKKTARSKRDADT